MTITEFKLDDASLREDILHSPERANPAALEETYFVMPVRFRINDAELLQLPKKESPWLPLPLLGFAANAVQVTKELLVNKEKKLYLPGGGHLMFARHDDQLSITSSINNRTALTQLSDVRGSLHDFADRVRQLLLQRIPRIKQHGSWDQWFPSKP
jgi:hypothetical protein